MNAVPINLGKGIENQIIDELADFTLLSGSIYDLEHSPIYGLTRNRSSLIYTLSTEVFANLVEDEKRTILSKLVDVF